MLWTGQQLKQDIKSGNRGNIFYLNNSFTKNNSFNLFLNLSVEPSAHSVSVLFSFLMMMKVMIWIRYLVGLGKYYWFCNPGQGVPFRRLHPFSCISTTVHSVHELISVPYRVIGRVNIQSLTNPNPDKLWPGPGLGCQTHRGPHTSSFDLK